jgi:hypothetical protein
MYRFSFLFAPVLLITLLTACTQGVSPCTGSSCPTPTTCEANPGDVQPSTPTGFTVTSTFKSCYARGASGNVVFNLKVAESKIPTDRVIVVVDVVTQTSNGSTTSVASQFFGSASDISVQPDIFRNGASKAELVAGLNATINFKFKSSSPVGDPYYFVISLFKGGGSTSNPKDVIGRIIYKFKTADE